MLSRPFGLTLLQDEFRLQQARELEFFVDFQSLGILDILTGGASFSLSPRRAEGRLVFKHNRLNSSGDDGPALTFDESDLSLGGTYALQRGQLDFNLGGNLRDDSLLVYGSLRWLHKPTGNIEGMLRVGVNEISYETASLRALGAKDKLSFGLSTHLTRQIFLQFSLDGHRYVTRQRSTLGEGYKINGVLGSPLIHGNPNWQVRLQGSWESNHLKDDLPSELRTRLPPTATVDTVVPSEYGTFGIGTTFRYGSYEKAFVRQPFLFADVWAGWSWPANVLAYHGRLAAGLSLFGPDVLSISAFYGNVQGGRANTDYTGVGLNYSVRF